MQALSPLSALLFIPFYLLSLSLFRCVLFHNFLPDCAFTYTFISIGYRLIAVFPFPQCFTSVLTVISLPIKVLLSFSLSMCLSVNLSLFFFLSSYFHYIHQTSFNHFCFQLSNKSCLFQFCFRCQNEVK